MCKKILFFLGSIFIIFLAVLLNAPNKEIYLDKFEDIAKLKGYKEEVHTLVTSDGYHLEI